MALCERVIDGHPSYDWVKHFYIDDPISSLDDNNAIAVASDLAKLLRKAKGRTRIVAANNQAGAESKSDQKIIDPIKVVLSSHHALFFNVVCNELKKEKCKRYFLHRPNNGTEFTLRATDATPFFHHVAMLSELREAADSGALHTYHFNMLRSILEKTATFFGKKDFSECLYGVKDEGLYSRALNLLSHGKYSLYEPVEMLEDNKQLFRDILAAFLDKHGFDLPALLNEVPAAVAAPLPEPAAAPLAVAANPKS
jgi:wobble nucleotide-excising tRNase